MGVETSISAGAPEQSSPGIPGPAEALDDGGRASVPPPSALSRRVADSAVSLVVRRIAVLLTVGVSALVLARLLEPAAYGVLQSAMAVWAIMLVVADLGFSLALGRELALPRADRRAVLRTAYQVQGAWALATSAALAVAGLVAGPTTDQGAVLLVLAPSVAATAFAAGRCYYLATYQTRRLVVIDVTVNVAQVLLVVGAAAVDAGLVVIAAATSLCTTVNAVTVGIAAWRSAARETRADREAAMGRRRLFRHVAPLGVTGILSKAYLSADLALMGSFVAPVALGNYAGAVKIVNLLNTVPGLVMSAALPGLSASREDRGEMLLLARRLVHWCCVTAVPAFVALAVFSGPVVRLVLGEGYRQAPALVCVLALAGLVAVASQVFGTVLVATATVRPMMLQNAVALVVNVAGVLILVPHHGVVVAAWFTVVTELVVCGGSLWTLRRILPVRAIVSGAGRVLLPTLGGAAVGLVLRDLDWVGLAAAGLTFTALVLRLRVWPQELRPRRRASAPVAGPATSEPPARP